MKAVVLCLIVVSLEIVQANRQCYEYSSMNGKQLTDTTKRTCALNQQFCVKIDSVVYDTGKNTNTITSRECALGNTCQKNGCYDYQNEKICCCSTDLCNSGSLFTGISSIFAMSVYQLLRG